MTTLTKCEFGMSAKLLTIRGFVPERFPDDTYIIKEPIIDCLGGRAKSFRLFGGIHKPCGHERAKRGWD